MRRTLQSPMRNVRRWALFEVALRQKPLHSAQKTEVVPKNNPTRQVRKAATAGVTAQIWSDIQKFTRRITVTPARCAPYLDSI